MSYPKILTIQDLSCLGQCSLTVALPILSACGIETCVLPCAVLSTHTTGFSGYTFRDLTDDMLKIQAHWKREGITFDALYTGYLANKKQILCVREILSDVKKTNGMVIVDPAMADEGTLYPGLDEGFAEAMRGLCQAADYIMPNVTEASLLAGVEYRAAYDADYIDLLLQKLLQLGCRNVVLTGVSYTEDKSGVVLYAGGQYSYYEHEKCGGSCHGTGDVYASAFVGALMRGRMAGEAMKIAADYTLACIKATAKESGHWYGVKFEPLLPRLIQALEGNEGM